MAKDIKYFELNTGGRLPSIGFGTYKVAPSQVEDAITAALKAGYRHIDCAPLYGNEKEVGDALKKLFKNGVVKREELWITSKLWCSDHAPEDVPLALNRTLKDLQLNYVDLYLIHWPVRMKKGSIGVAPQNLTKTDIPSTWRAMEALYDDGKARAIGVSNFSCRKLADLLDIARIPPAVNQMECHPSWQQQHMHSLCQYRGVHLSGYRPLGSPNKVGVETKVLENPILVSVAKKLGKTPAQVALRWGLQMGHSVLPKSSNEKRIKENFDLFGWSIPEYLCAQISQMEQVRLISGGTFVDETYGSYRTIQELWDED